MDAILKLLTKGLEKEERDSLTRRVDVMRSELRYLKESKPEMLSKASSYGWSFEKLEVAFCLNSFYQRIIAPLWASAISSSFVGTEIPVRYGKSIVFDFERNERINKMSKRFLAMCRKCEIERHILEAQRTSDLIWKINHPPVDPIVEEDDE